MQLLYVRIQIAVIKNRLPR